MNKNSFTIAAIAVLAAVFATGATMSSELAFASGHHSSNPNRQTLAQDNYCGNGSLPLDVKCQNVGSQVRGSHNAVNIIGTQPSKSGEMNHGDDHGSSSSDDHDGSNQHPSGNPPDNPNNPGVPSHPSLPGNNNQNPSGHSPGNNNQNPSGHSPGNNNQNPSGHSPGNNNQNPSGHSPGNNNQNPGSGKPQTSALQNGIPSGNPAIGAGI
jgi:hypothetical protein